jgi:hypothetical protein
MREKGVNLMGQQPKPGQISVTTMKPKHARQHIALITEHAQIAADYGSHGAAFGSQGAFSPGGAAGADYETSSTGNTGDADSTGATGY